MSIVRMFEENLLISRREAILRISGIAPCLLVVLWITQVNIFTFPYQDTKEQTVELIPGDYTIVRSITDSNVWVDREEFMRWSGNRFFVVLDPMGRIDYMVKAGDVSYRYRQVAPRNETDYVIASQRIEGNILHRYLQRGISRVIIRIVGNFFLLAVGVYLCTLMINKETFSILNETRTVRNIFGSVHVYKK